MRILFVKTSSLGDVLHQLPAVADVCRALPNAQIDWVVELPFDVLPAMHRQVSTVFPVAIRQWRRRFLTRQTWRDMRACRDALRRQTYDAVIDTQGLLKSALISLQALGVRHGYDYASAREPIASWWYDVKHSVSRQQHAVQRNRQLVAQALSLPQPRAASCDYGLQVNTPNPFTCDGPYAVLLSMSSRDEKLWPEAEWVRLVQQLSTQGITSVLPWGNSPEQARVERIVAAAGVGVVPAFLTLPRVAALLADARYVIGVDTGLTHLGVALGRPSVGIYVSTDPAYTGLYGESVIANLGGPQAVPSAQAVFEILERHA